MAHGLIIVAGGDNDRIQKFDSSGNYLAQWGSPGSGDGEFSNASDIAVDAAGNVYVVDTINNRIQKFAANTFHLDDAVPDDGDGVTNTRVFSNLAAGSYTITEDLPAGDWSLDSITCDSGNWTPNLGAQTLSVTLASGDDVTCTFTNTKDVPGYQIFLPIVIH